MRFVTKTILSFPFFPPVRENKFQKDGGNYRRTTRRRLLKEDRAIEDTIPRGERESEIETFFLSFRPISSGMEASPRVVL